MAMAMARKETTVEMALEPRLVLQVVLATMAVGTGGEATLTTGEGDGRAWKQICRPRNSGLRAAADVQVAKQVLYSSDDQPALRFVVLESRPFQFLITRVDGCLQKCYQTSFYAIIKPTPHAHCGNMSTSL